MTGSPPRTVRRTPTMASALGNAAPTHSSTVLPWAAAASVAWRYSSSSIVNVDMHITSSSSKSRPQTGAPPSRQMALSRGLLLQSIVMMQSTQNGFTDYTQGRCKCRCRCSCRDVGKGCWWRGNTRSQGHVRTPHVIIAHPCAQQTSQVVFTQRNQKSKHSRRAVPSSRSHSAFACGLWGGVFSTRRPR